ncbi:MAG: hypothetical protein Q9209_001914 [Squamulea sp. 1 TL-2023]
MDSSPQSYGIYSARERKPSPATSFLDNFALGASPAGRPQLSKLAETYGNNHGQEYREAYDRDLGYGDRQSEASKTNNILKRSAVSPVEGLRHQDAVKRLRNDNHSAQSQVENQPRRKADAATQTEVPETAFARIALLREEETAAKAKHEAEMAMAQARYEAEFARRRQVMAEVEYESKMSALRQLSEVSSKKSTTPTPAGTSGSASMGKSDPSRAQSSTNGNVIDALNTAREHAKSVSLNRKVEEAPRAPAANTSQHSKGETTTASHHSTNQSSSTPKRLPDAPSNVNGLVKQTSAPDAGKATVKPAIKPAAKPLSPPRERPDSSSNHSVYIKTSRSPPLEPRARPEADIWSPKPGLKHLTCYFWKNTAGCSKSATDCNYAHFDTGVTATDPERLRRYKRR